MLIKAGMHDNLKTKQASIKPHFHPKVHNWLTIIPTLPPHLCCGTISTVGPSICPILTSCFSRKCQHIEEKCVHLAFRKVEPSKISSSSGCTKMNNTLWKALYKKKKKKLVITRKQTSKQKKPPHNMKTNLSHLMAVPPTYILPFFPLYFFPTHLVLSIVISPPNGLLSMALFWQANECRRGGKWRAVERKGNRVRFFKGYQSYRYDRPPRQQIHKHETSSLWTYTVGMYHTWALVLTH